MLYICICVCCMWCLWGVCECTWPLQWFWCHWVTILQRSLWLIEWLVWSELMNVKDQKDANCPILALLFFFLGKHLSRCWKSSLLLTQQRLQSPRPPHLVQKTPLWQKRGTTRLYILYPVCEIVAWLLVPDGPVWVFQKQLIFRHNSLLEFTQNDVGKKTPSEPQVLLGWWWFSGQGVRLLTRRAGV